jgi:phosphate transport system substrate-binding protein
MTMRRTAAACGSLLIAALSIFTGAPAAVAESHALISGSGSGWAANAVNQWIADVQSNGLQVVYTAVGSAQGRKDFAYKTTDYAVSDIGYQGVDPVTQEEDTSLGRQYAYLPIVAGGTAFPYHIIVAGRQVRTLRLSGETIAKIFTNKITNWNDPQIAADNNHHFWVGDQSIGSLPSLPIIPVVHSEGAGTTAQFTTYLNTVYPSIWQPFFGHNTFTEYYPRHDDAIAQNGSDGVMNFVASSAANGAIGYDEYSYALGKNYPVVKVLNKAGYFTLPNQYNVAVALTRANINTNKSSPNYLLQDLRNVYVYDDPRTYPLSSYSYAIIPTGSDDSRMSTAKRQTLADWLFFSACQGQAEMGPIGYSPLPINLVQASFDQIGKLKTADPNVDLTRHDVTNCHNPTFIAGQPSRNYLAEIAPKPPACDKVGAGPCSGDTPNPTGNPVNGHPGGSTDNNDNNPNDNNPNDNNGNNPDGNNPDDSNNADANPSAGPTTGPSADSSLITIDPITGQQVGSTDTSGDSADLIGSATTLSASRTSGLSGLFAVLAVVELLAVLILPPLVYRRIAARKGAK